MQLGKMEPAEDSCPPAPPTQIGLEHGAKGKGRKAGSPVGQIPTSAGWPQDLLRLQEASGLPPEDLLLCPHLSTMLRQAFLPAMQAQEAFSLEGQRPQSDYAKRAEHCLVFCPALPSCEIVLFWNCPRAICQGVGRALLLAACSSIPYCGIHPGTRACCCV